MEKFTTYIQSLEENGIEHQVINGQGYYKVIADGKESFWSAYTHSRLPKSWGLD